MTRRLLALLLLVAPRVFAVPLPVDYVDEHGREWVNLGTTAYRSWIDVIQACSSATGYCGGVLQGNGGWDPVDLNGYTWATRDEVRELFYETAGLPDGSLDDYEETVPFLSGYTDQFFANVTTTYEPNYDGQPFKVVNGFTRDVTYDSDYGLAASLGQVTSGVNSQTNFSLPFGWSINAKDPSIGAYVYRVPEPGTLALFGFGLLGIVAARRTRA